MAKKIRGKSMQALSMPANYSDCFQCSDCLEVTPYGLIICQTAIPPVENCKERKIKCVRFITGKRKYQK